MLCFKHLKWDPNIFPLCRFFAYSSRQAGHRFGEHLNKIMPHVIKFCREEDDELREYCLQAFESFVRRCPKEISPFVTEVSCFCNFFIKWAASRQNQQNGMCTQRRLRSAWASAQSDQSSLSTWRKLGSLATHWVHSKDSDQMIWVLTGSSHFVGFVVRQLILRCDTECDKILTEFSKHLCLEKCRTRQVSQWIEAFIMLYSNYYFLLFHPITTKHEQITLWL